MSCAGLISLTCDGSNSSYHEVNVESIVQLVGTAKEGKVDIENGKGQRESFSKHSKLAMAVFQGYHQRPCIIVPEAQGYSGKVLNMCWGISEICHLTYS